MQTGDAVKFRTVNGSHFEGTVRRVWDDATGRTWLSVQVPDLKCPFLVLPEETEPIK